MSTQSDMSAEEKAISDAVDKAVEEHGALSVTRMIDRKLGEVRLIQRSGDYPKAMYGADGKTVTVESKAEQAKLGKGWSEKPGNSHREAAAASSAAVAETTTRVDAETALRNAAHLVNPADSTARSAAAGAGVLATDSTTTTVPNLLLPVSDAPADAPKDTKSGTLTLPAKS